MATVVLLRDVVMGNSAIPVCDVPGIPRGVEMTGEVGENTEDPNLGWVPLDPRSFCNLLLDEAERAHNPITHLALQKLLYFSHAIYLIESRKPLVSGYFEAWTRGPVHPGAYKAFKAAGARPIEFRAQAEDLLTGRKTLISPPTDTGVLSLAQRITGSYGKMTAFRLVEISHARGAPWDFVVRQARASMALGLRISDAVIREKFKYHKICITDDVSLGETSEDTPFA